MIAALDNVAAEKTKLARRKNRVKVLEHYTGGTASCSICGGPVDEATFCLVAVSDEARQLRKMHHSRLGARFYSTVVRLGFPAGFVVTCPPCVNPRRESRESTTDFQTREALAAAGFRPDGREG